MVTSKTQHHSTMPISWNEIKTRAYRFVNEWKDTEREEADAKPFLIEFLDVFGVTRKRVARFEHRVKKRTDASGYIDMLWPGMMLVEMKSRGQNLDKAYKQATEYIQGLKEHELPALVLICDFETFHLYDEDGVQHVFTLRDLVKNLHLFSSIAGYEKRDFKDQDPVNIRAAELMGKLHDQLKAMGYEGHQLEVYLVRLLFILFADDTNIFNRGIFLEYLMDRTAEDGSDLAYHLDAIFSVLNKPEDKRLKNTDEQLNQFPYVNGKLFQERLEMAAFDREMRTVLLQCCALDWSQISPAIFGSLFQSVMDEKARRNLGAHYTSERNILKVIRPLFMDELNSEFVADGDNRTKLLKLHDKISKLRFLDPACGCGNFLVIAYRELRLLELEIVKKLLKGQTVTNIAHYFLVDVDQFYGIEYEEFPSQIAQVAMWLIDHQMNMIASDAFGEYMPRIPLRKSAVIKHGNALRTDWQSLIVPGSQDKEPPRFHYIMGNPPFIGHQWRNEQQMEDMDVVFKGVNRAGRLDYVASWYLLAARYLDTYNEVQSSVPTQVAFVSTNSICQGEQVSVLWGTLFSVYKIKILFAHRTFKWGNEARGNAAVHVVIVGFSNYDKAPKRIYEYDDIKGDSHEVIAKNINPYLVEGADIFIQSRGKPLHQYPEMFKGSQPTDGGNLVLAEEEKKQLVRAEPDAGKWIRPYLGAEEFINNTKRYCLWLKGIDPKELRSLKLVQERVRAVAAARLKSPTPSVKEFAKYPTLFTQDRQPNTNYLVVPEVSSENRMYIPIGFLKPEVVCSNKLQIIPGASPYMFGVLHSLMHMVWVRYVGGRLKSDFSYSPSVYNNFPWPVAPTEKQVSAVEDAAKGVLTVRASFKGSSLADLYARGSMPPELVAAHKKLDKAVDLCYRSNAFTNETKRIEFLFDLYEKYTAGLFAPAKNGSGKQRSPHVGL